MKRRKLRAGGRGLRLVLVSTVLLAVAAGVAYATIPGPAGVINGCYRTSLDDQRGQLRVVEDPASCRSSETAIQWNQQGPKGDTGEPGIRGLPGDKGDKGDTGAAGADGTNGVDGTDGQPGANGTDGVDGAPGAPGAPCLPSNPACVGPKGDKGEPGVDGTNGTQGLQGPPGGVSGYEQITGSQVELKHGGFANASATCSAGKVPVAGGWGSFSQTARAPDFLVPDYLVMVSRPTSDGWSVGLEATGPASTGSIFVTAFVICVSQG